MSGIRFGVSFEEVLNGMRIAGGEELAGKLEAFWVASKMAEYVTSISKVNGVYRVGVEDFDQQNDRMIVMCLHIRYAEENQYVAAMEFDFKESTARIGAGSINIFGPLTTIKETDKKKVGIVLDEALKKLAVM